MPVRRGRWSWRAVLWVVSCALAWWLPKDAHAAAHTQPGAEPWQWIVPAGAQIANANLRGQGKPVSLALPVHLTPGQVLLIPARRGAHFRIRGEGLRAGIATGAETLLPNAVAWLYAPAPTQLRLPTWSPVEFLALSTDHPTRVEVHLAADRPHDMEAYRLNAAVYQWLEEDRGTAPHSNRPIERRQLRALLALRELMHRAHAGDTPVPSKAKRWLQAHWLIESLEQRDLRRPFFVSRWHAPAGTSALFDPDDSDFAWSPLSSTEHHSIDSRRGEVVLLQLQAKAIGRTRVEVYNDEQLVHSAVFRVPRRREAPGDWTRTKSLRVLSHGAPLRVALTEGAAKIRVRSFSPQYGVTETANAHVRAPLPPSGNGDWLDALLNYQDQPSRSNLQEIRKQLTPALFTSPLPRDQARLALLLHATLPVTSDLPDLKSHWSQLWLATKPLPSRLRTALRIQVVRHTLQRTRNALPHEWNPSMSEISTVRTEPSRRERLEQTLLAVLLESLFTPQDRHRPISLAPLEEQLLGAEHDPFAVTWTRRAWSRAAPWAAASPVQGAQRLLTRRLVEQPQVDALCDTRGPQGRRWWQVPKEPQPISIADLGGTHSVVLFRPMDANVTEDSLLSLDGVDLSVHPQLSEPSRMAVTPGSHQLHLKEGPNVLALIPWEVRLPCEQLREGELWTQLDHSLEYSLPASQYGTIASFVVHPTSLEDEPLQLEFKVGNRTILGQILAPATGDLAVNVPAGVQSITVTTKRPALIRARLRRHPGQTPSAPVAGSSQSGSPSLDPFAELSKMTRALQAAESAQDRRTIRLRRATLLFDLGYRAMAHRQWLRAGVSPGTKDWSQTGALFLPHRSASVLALGLIARTPRLPSTNVSTQLLHQQFLLAREASLEGFPEVASNLYARLGHATSHPAMWEAAALEYDRLAQRTQRLDYTQRAFALAKASNPEEGKVRGLLSRYASLISWRAPSLSALGQSRVKVLSAQARFGTPSAGAKAQRALLDAPDPARLLHSSTRYSLKSRRGQRLDLTALCFARDGDREQCTLQVQMDGVPLACPAAIAPRSDVAQRQHCQFDVPSTALELTLQLPLVGRAIGWSWLRGIEAHFPTALTSTTGYSRITPEYPANLTVQGPVALRLRVRTLGHGKGQLRLTVRSSRGGSPSQHLFPLAVDIDSTAQILRGPSVPLSREQRFEHVLLSAGSHRLRFEAVETNVALRPEFARLVTPPPPPALPPSSPLTQEVLQQGPPAQPAANVRVNELPLRSGFASSTSVVLRDRDLSNTDNDANDRYLQVGSTVRKRLSTQNIWLQANGQGRIRRGPASLAGSLRADYHRPGTGWRAFGQVRLAVQPALKAAGWGGALGVSHRSRAAWGVPIEARSRFTLRSPAARPARTTGVDGSVFSNYAATHRSSLDLELLTRQRPFVDTLITHSTRLRLNPDLTSVDRLDLRSTVHSLFGKGWAPWLRLALNTSYRPATSLRRSSYTRFTLSPRASFWHWIDSGQRARTDWSLSAFADSPQGQFGIFFALTATYDSVGTLGLNEHRPALLPFRQRLEEDGPTPSPYSAPLARTKKRIVPP